MGGRKITLTVSCEVWDNLAERAKSDGFGGVPALVRYLAVNGIKADAEANEDRRTLRVPVDNYRELAGYVSEKKFGTVESFATFSMGAYMSRFPLTEAQKRRVVKLSE